TPHLPSPSLHDALPIFANLGTLPAKIDRILTHHNALRRGLGQPEIAPETIMEELRSVADRILPFRETVWRLLDSERRKGSRILRSEEHTSELQSRENLV